MTQPIIIIIIIIIIITKHHHKNFITIIIVKIITTTSWPSSSSSSPPPSSSSPTLSSYQVGRGLNEITPFPVPGITHGLSPFVFKWGEGELSCEKKIVSQPFTQNFALFAEQAIYNFGFLQMEGELSCEKKIMSQPFTQNFALFAEQAIYNFGLDVKGGSSIPLPLRKSSGQDLKTQS